MPDIRPAATLKATPALAGTDIRIGANLIRARGDLALVSVAVPLGGESALAVAFRAAWDLDLPDARRSRGNARMRALRTASDQLMLVFAHATPDANAVVRAALAGAGYTTDQTDVWTVLEISGPDTRAALERLCPLDLSPCSFPTGAFARTVVEHMGTIILRPDEQTFLLMSASSSAVSFLDAVETSYRFVMEEPV